jgi:hypothetical protein
MLAAAWNHRISEEVEIMKNNPKRLRRIILVFALAALTSAARGEEGLTLLAKGISNKRVYENNFTSYNQAWSGWTEVPGSMTTQAGIGAVNFDNSVYAFIVDSDNQIWMNRKDGCGFWGVWKKVPGGMTTKFAVASVVFSGKLYVFATGLDNHIWRAYSQNGTSWSSWTRLAGTTDASPAVTTFSKDPCFSPRKLYLFAKGIADKGIYVSTSSDAVSWSAWTALGGTTDAALNATTTVLGFCGSPGGVQMKQEQTIYLFAKGISDKRIYLTKTKDGTTWSAWSLLGGTTDVAVSAYPAPSGGGLAVFAKGVADNRIYQTWSSNGLSWPAWSQVPGGGTTDASLGVAAQGLCIR